MSLPRLASILPQAHKRRRRRQGAGRPIHANGTRALPRNSKTRGQPANALPQRHRERRVKFSMCAAHKKFFLYVLSVSVANPPRLFRLPLPPISAAPKTCILRHFYDYTIRFHGPCTDPAVGLPKFIARIFLRRSSTISCGRMPTEARSDTIQKSCMGLCSRTCSRSVRRCAGLSHCGSFAGIR